MYSRLIKKIAFTINKYELLRLYEEIGHHISTAITDAFFPKPPINPNTFQKQWLKALPTLKNILDRADDNLINPKELNITDAELKNLNYINTQIELLEHIAYDETRGPELLGVSMAEFEKLTDMLHQMFLDFDIKNKPLGAGRYGIVSESVEEPGVYTKDTTDNIQDDVLEYLSQQDHAFFQRYPIARIYHYEEGERGKHKIKLEPVHTLLDYFDYFSKGKYKDPRTLKYNHPGFKNRIEIESTDADQAFRQNDQIRIGKNLDLSHIIWAAEEAIEFLTPYGLGKDEEFKLPNGQLLVLKDRHVGNYGVRVNPNGVDELVHIDIDQSDLV